MLNPAELRGIITPIVTPVTPAQAVDYEALRRLVRHVLAGGVQGIFVMGGTGNFCSFTAEERFQVARAVVEQVGGRVPVLVGAMDSSTRLVIRRVQDAVKAGADAVVVEPPFYYPCTEEDVIAHYRAVAEASEVPIIIYNIPPANKVNIDIHLTRKLAEIPKIVAMKDSTSDFVFFQDLVATFGGSPFQIIQGQEPLAGSSFLLGADGGILAIGNVVPKLCVDLFEAGKKGDLETTRELQAQLMTAFSIVRRYADSGDGSGYYTSTVGSFFAGLHCALKILGIAEGVLTVPYSQPSASDYARVRDVLMRLELVPA